MASLKNIFGHFWTVTKHKYYVCIECFKVGLYWQGLIHDLSKYSPIEFLSSAKYFQGDESPIVKERSENGFSKVWVNHKAKNKHHFQYWIDISSNGEYIPIEMPYRYVLEMACDSIGAGKAYGHKSFNNDEPLEYWERTVNKKLLHFKTAALMEKFLRNYSEKGKLIER